MRVRLAVPIAVLVLLLGAGPASAGSGEVSHNDVANVFLEASGQGTGSSLNVGTPTAGAIEIEQTNGDISASGAGCNAVGTVVTCDSAAFFSAVFGSLKDQIDATAITDATKLNIQAGDGDDDLYGSKNGDVLSGEAGFDIIDGKAGDDQIDGGAGDNSLYDGDGNDTVVGGIGADTWYPGAGADSFTGGAGSDTADYEARPAALTLNNDGVANDGEAGEGDNIAADVENLWGGNGNDVIVSNSSAGYLYGRGGNDTITAGMGGNYRVDGGDGDDTIDSRNGVFDSIECGPGNDTVFADTGDETVNCEVAPDADGDGFNIDVDCAPTDPNINPGKGEVNGNTVDENCDGIFGFERIVPSISYTGSPVKKKGFRYKTLTLKDLRAGDSVVVKCSGKKKACPFKTKTKTVGAKGTVNLVKLFKKKPLKKVTVTITVTRPSFIGAVQRYSISKKGKVTSTKLCLPPGAAKAGPCAA